jgi:hypothetical protein
MSEWTAEEQAAWDAMYERRLADWTAVLADVIATYDDEGVALWIAHFKGDRSAMLKQAAMLGGQVAT